VLLVVDVVPHVLPKLMRRASIEVLNSSKAPNAGVSNSDAQVVGSCVTSLDKLL